MSKSRDTKLEFIKARAEGKSYRTIAKELSISPSTCYEWAKEFKSDIDRLSQERLAEVYEVQRLNREARLEAIGSHRQKILEALEQKDYTEVPADKLADMLLKADKAIAEYDEIGREPESYTTLFNELNLLLLEAKQGKLAASDISSRVALLNKIDIEQGGLDIPSLSPLKVPQPEYYTADARAEELYTADNSSQA